MITRNRILFAIGILTVLFPYSGFPSDIKKILITISGLAVMLLAFLYARDKRMMETHGEKISSHSESTIARAEVVTNTFAESRPVSFPKFQKPERAERNFRPLPDPQSPEEKYTDLKSIMSRSKNFN